MNRVFAHVESRKRKVMDPTTSPKPLTRRNAVTPPSSSNRLLAGYMAYEFLTKGSLLGQKFDKARLEAVAVGSDDLRTLKQIRNQAETIAKAATPHVYREVAHVLKSDGVNIPGIVNPTQLGRWIRM